MLTVDQNLGSLKSLKILSIQSNRILKLEGVEDLTNLEELYLSHNGIEKIEGLEKNVCRLIQSHSLYYLLSIDQTAHTGYRQQFHYRIGKYLSSCES